MSTHSAERRAAVKAGCKPVHFSLDGCPLSCYFSGSVAPLRDTLSTSRSAGRGPGAFIYALSADETSPALAAPRHAITALFSCCFKCPCPTRRQPHFRSNADRAYNTLHFASKVVCQGASPFGNPGQQIKAEYQALGKCEIFSLFCCPGFPKGLAPWHTTLLAKCSVLYALSALLRK